MNDRLNSNNDNDNLVIIKTKNETYSLEKDKYNEELLGDIITKNTFNEIIDSATRVMGQSWIKKRANDQLTIRFRQETPTWFLPTEHRP